MKLSRLIAFLLVFIAIERTPRAHAEEQKHWEPPLCIGLRSPAGTPPKWGLIGISEHFQRDDCPAGYAFVGAEPTGGRYGIAERVPVVGACCQLPPDALTNDTLLALASCPDGYVATGAKVLPSPEKEWWAIPKALRCTKINTTRYMLGDTRLSVRVSPARELADMPFLRQIIGEYSQFINTSGHSPVGFRYALGRNGWRSWSADSCTGYPWASLLVAKAPRGCNFSFRQLQYRGLTNDPPRGTPVKLYPDCDYLDDPLSANPKCIRGPQDLN